MRRDWIGPRKATLGSTTYDGAVTEPPAWDGSAWYGAASGTYWTVNPREYADPRKHGPEYLGRTNEWTGDGSTPAAPASGQAGHAPDGGPASATADTDPRDRRGRAADDARDHGGPDGRAGPARDARGPIARGPIARVAHAIRSALGGLAARGLG